MFTSSFVSQNTPYFFHYTSSLSFILNVRTGGSMCAPLVNPISAFILRLSININACRLQIHCDSSDFMFPSYFVSIHYSFLPLFAPQKVIFSLHFRENWVWMDKRGRWLRLHLSLCLFRFSEGWCRSWGSAPTFIYHNCDRLLSVRAQQVVVCSFVAVWHPYFSQFHDTPLTSVLEY